MCEKEQGNISSGNGLRTVYLSETRFITSCQGSVLQRIQLYSESNTKRHHRPVITRHQFQPNFKCHSELHSVATAFITSTNDWYLNIDKGKYAGLIFVDLKKISDTVGHEILFKNLKIYSVTGLEHDWSTSYLENRGKFCRIGGTSSDVKRIICGGPQGSCLDPLLFLICINDLPLCIQKISCTHVC